MQTKKRRKKDTNSPHIIKGRKEGERKKRKKGQAASESEGKKKRETLERQFVRVAYA